MDLPISDYLDFIKDETMVRVEEEEDKQINFLYFGSGETAKKILDRDRIVKSIYLGSDGKFVGIVLKGEKK